MRAGIFWQGNLRTEHVGMKETKLIEIADSLSDFPDDDICLACRGMIGHARRLLQADALLCIIRKDCHECHGEPMILHSCLPEVQIDALDNADWLGKVLALGTDTLLPVDLAVASAEVARPLLSMLPGKTGHAMLIPLHGPGGEYGVIILVVQKPPRPWPLYMRSIAPELHLFAMRLFDCIVRNMRARQGNPAELTGRERECLYWCAQGKSYWETAVILGIAERTVNHHMKMVRDKLGVQTNAQAVSLASARGLFKSYMPPVPGKGGSANDKKQQTNR